VGRRRADLARREHRRQLLRAAWQSWKSGVTDISTAADSLRALAEAASAGTDAQGQARGRSSRAAGCAEDGGGPGDQARAACRG
jgi:hypothetical protein